MESTVKKVRTTITVDEETYNKILRLRGTDDRYLRMSVSGIVEDMIKRQLCGGADQRPA